MASKCNSKSGQAISERGMTAEGKGPTVCRAGGKGSRRWRGALG